MSEDLEFHYVISYRDGFGWQIASDVCDAVMEDGTIYDWESEPRDEGWFNAYEDSEDDEMAAIAAVDTAHYRVLQSMLARMNGE